MAPSRVNGAAHDACVVPAAGEQEREFGRGGETARLVDGFPRRHVIGLGADHEHRHADVPEAHRFALDLEAPLGQVVVQVEADEYSVCIFHGMRVPSAFQAIRSIIPSRSPLR